MKKIFLSLMCILLLFLNLATAFSVFAEENCTVTVGKVSGNIGETVYVPTSIDNNPGISGVTIDFTYNSSALTFVKHKKGPAFTDNLMLKDHPDKNMIKIALVEYSKDSTNNDVILTLEFQIKENTNADFYPINVEYDKGDFANKELESIMPEIISGGVEVKYNPDAKNCAHKTYGEWEIAVKPTCKENGIEQRFCTLCGHKETKDTEAAGHIFEDVWTIDKVASKTEDGVMTRHCKHCTYTVDRITFPYSDPNKESFENSLGTEVPKNEYTENLFEEQHPGEVLTGTKTESVDSISSVVSSKLNESTTESISTVNTESEINSETTIINSDAIETEYEALLSNDENIEQSNNKLLLTISGGIILFILLAIIAIVTCQKTR